MRGLRMLAAVSVFVFAAQACARAQASKGSKRTAPARVSAADNSAEELRRLIEATGVVERELKALDPMLAGLRKKAPQVPEKVWKEVEAEFKSAFTRETVIDMYAPAYKRHFEPDEIRRLLAFYTSPVGKKLVEVSPMMEMEVFLEGVERGMNIGEKIRELLKARGYDTPIT